MLLSFLSYVGPPRVGDQPNVAFLVTSGPCPRSRTQLIERESCRSESRQDRIGHIASIDQQVLRRDLERIGGYPPRPNEPLPHRQSKCRKIPAHDHIEALFLGNVAM